MPGEAVVRLAHDPSPPTLLPVRLQTSPVLSDDTSDDAEQRQEQADTPPESGTLTLFIMTATSQPLNKKIRLLSVRESN